MESVKKIIRTNDARQTEFYFSRLNGDGFNNEQIQFLVELISKYLNKYKKLVINKVTDLYDEKEFFYTNESGEKYEDIPILGQYFWEAKKIRLNHIRVSRMPLNDTDFIRNIAARAQQVYEVENKIDHIKWTAMKKGIKYEDLQKEFERDPKMKDFINFLREKEVLSNPLENGICSILLIRILELEECVKRIIIHEVGHALAYQYSVASDQEIIELYQKYERDFEDIQEFIAECFMASEFTSKIKVAKKVRDIINRYTGVWD